MNSPRQSRRATIRTLATRVVRVFSVSALLAGGFVTSAEALAETSLESDDDVRHARSVLAKAAEEVLAQPPMEGDRALLAILAAQEAIDTATVADPTEQHLQDILTAAQVAQDAARG
jgi:hypothetical protein